MTDLSVGRDGGYRPVAAQDAGLDGTERDGGPLPFAMHYMGIALRRRWLILGCIASALVLGIVITLLMTPQFTATTRIEISREGNRIVNVGGVEPEASVIDMEFYQTQYGLLYSRSLAERVATQLRLPDNPGFFEAFGESTKYEEASGQGIAAPGVVRSRRLRLAGDILLRHIDVAPIRSSRLVDVSFTGPDPEFAARVANAWTTSFIQTNLDRRYEATAYARQFLERRLGEVRGRLEQSERQLVGYASNQQIINIPVAGPPGTQSERSLTADRLASLNAALAQATADRVEAESRLRHGAGGAVTEALTNTAISAMRQRRAEATAERSRLLTQFEPGYPAVQALNSQIANLDQSISREEARVQGSLNTAYQNSLQRETDLGRRVNSLKEEFLDLRRRSIQYNIFQRDVDTNRSQYDGLLNRYKEIDTAAGVGTNNVSIVDPAPVPTKRSHPRPLLNLLAALAIGVISGVALALVREQIDETVTDPTDLERKIGLPLLGVVPTSKSGDMLAEIRDPKSSLIEAYISIQTNLSFSTDHGIPKSIAVTSARPAEGKSTTAYAIAHTIARNGGRTLLVDGDMRSPSVGVQVGVGNERGLSNYLVGPENLDTLIQRTPDVPFAVLTAGPQPPNAAELLRGKRFEALMEELGSKFDHIIIDCPPVMGLADAPIIASRSEATVFVLETRAVKARTAMLALGRLRQSRAHLIGVVLTKFEAHRAHFGYGYDYGYGYGDRENA